VVALREVPEPAVGNRDLLVRVHATTVNRTDCAYRAGRPAVARPAYGIRRPRVNVLGCEFAGVVERTGDQVASFATGDRVFGYVEGPFGAHAEFLTVPEHASVAHVPAGVDLVTAATATEGAHYALAFVRVTRIRPGHDVLVLGATGGIGSAAVQLLKAGGATVTAAARGHTDVVLGLGADSVIAAAAEDVPDDGRRYDAVLDAVGKGTFGQARPLLKPSGVYVSSELGPKAQNLLLAALSPLMRGRRVRFPYPLHDQAMIRRLAELLADGRFRPLIDRHYPLDRIVEAYEYVESGQKLGNVVIDVVPRT
jgi:NADPH:quinone reductase-like Zn-dependent oxidoreductase